MASREEVQKIMKNIEGVELAKVFRALNESTAGIGAVLRILHENGGCTTSKQICDFLGVSSARVAVLLKTMESKKLISKRKDVLDARLTIVTLTDFGSETTRKMCEEVYNQINRIIDHVGFEKLEQFFAISKEIEQVVEHPKILF